MSESLVIGCIVLFGCLVAASAAHLRVAAPRTYWMASAVWMAAVTIVAFVLSAHGPQSGETFAAAILVGVFPVLATFVVARRMTSGPWLAIALAAASWLTALYVGITFGLSSGLLRK